MRINHFYYKYHNEQTIQDIPTSIINFYDLTLVFNGELEYKINNKYIQLKKGDVILIPPNSKRERININHPAEYSSFNFYTDVPINLPMIMRDILDTNFSHFTQIANSLTTSVNTLYDDTLNSLIKTIISLIINKRAEKKYNDVTKGIIKYITTNYRSNVSVSTISKSLNYSESYCIKIFKKDTGNSIMNYCTEKRISIAKALLLENKLSIKEIAETSGFPDQNYFSRIFKKSSGISPLAFRKRHLQ